MTATGEDAVAILRSIESMLKLILARTPIVIKPVSAPSAVASDEDLDGKYGDPVVKAKSPSKWTGADMSGRKFSQCPAEYLDMVADRLDYFAGRQDDTEEGRKKARFNALDAGRARGWAARIRGGYVAPVSAMDAPVEDDPFGGF